MQSEFLTLDILGRRLRVLGEHHRVARWLEGRWGFPRYAGLPESAFSIELEVRTTRPNQRPLMQPTSIQIAEYTFAVEQDSVITRLEGERCGISYQPGPSSHILFWGEVSYEGQTLLYNALSEMIAFTGLLPLHASIASHSGVAVAFLGPSGTGKTTTLRKALAKGWSVVAEDTAWVDPLSEMVYGWDKGVRILPHDLALWQELFPKIEPGPLVWGKHFVSYSQLGVVPTAAKLARLAFQRRSQTTLWRPLSPREAALYLWEAVGLPIHPGVSSAYNQMVTQVIGSFEMFELTLGFQDEPITSMPPAKKDLPPTN